jgi:NAD(P)-dependent dehydrogenase (short-subunit alcohol dehydrogenase family)
MGRLSGKVAIVTGAAMGIGQATAVLMAREGARVVVADLKIDAARAVVAQSGFRRRAACISTRERMSIEALIRQTRELYGALHVLHNNVGGTDVSRDNSVVEMDWGCWETALKLNLGSTVYACRCAIPVMLASGGGSIINTSSMVAVAGDVRPTAYAAARAA